MRISVITTYPIQMGSSQRFRLGIYLPRLYEDGHEVFIDSFHTEASMSSLFKRGRFISKALFFIVAYVRRYLRLFQHMKSDVVFIQRETGPIGPPIIAWALRYVLRKRLVYDFDDAIWLPNYSASNRHFHLIKYYKKTSMIIRWSHQVIAGNDFLADYAQQYNTSVTVIPTIVDTDGIHDPDNYDSSSDDERFKLCWTGSNSTLQHLTMLSDILHRLSESFEFRLVVISDEAPSIPLPNLEFHQWSREQEIRPLIGSDLGLMPLPDEYWAKGKCGFKAIQYMALGIPTLASPIGVNSSIIEDGVNGFLCEDAAEFEQRIVDALNDGRSLHGMAQASRKRIVNHYSLQKCYPSFVSVLEESKT